MVTHQMEEVERLCDRVILLKDGTAEAYGTIDEVQNKYGGRIIRIRYGGTIPRSPHYDVSLQETNYAELSITDATDEAAILKDLVDAGVRVRSFTTTKVSLEDIFIRVYGDQNVPGSSRPRPRPRPPWSGKRCKAVAQHNLGTVIGFEFIRTVTKRRFWIGTLSVPVIMAVVFGLIFLSNTTTDTASQAQKLRRVHPLLHGRLRADHAPGRRALRRPPGRVRRRRASRPCSPATLEAYFDFPATPGLRGGARLRDGQGDLRERQVCRRRAGHADPRRRTEDRFSRSCPRLAAGKARSKPSPTTARQESGGLGSVIPPLVFLVIFYGLIVLLAGQMLNSTLEEKENRVTEMILTTLKPTTLIAGKVIALFAIGLVQMIVFLSPILIARLLLPEQLNPAALDLPPLIFDPVRMTIGFLILIGGFALFTTTLVAIGAVMPTAKEAGNVLGVMMALIFVPFYAVALVVSDPHAVIVQIFTYFPFSAPVTALLRNGFGSLNPLEAGIVILILFVGAAVMLRIAVRLFQYGSISYTSKVNIRTALRAGSARVG